MSTPFMQLYVADYLGDTRHLSTEQHGAYLLLLMAMWRAGGFLPADDATLARVAGLTVTRWNRIKGFVMAFLIIDNGQVTQKRLLAELKKAEEKSKKRAEAGRAGGSAKALKDNEPELAIATALPEHSSEPEPESEPEEEEQESATARAAAEIAPLQATSGQSDLLGDLIPTPSPPAVVEVTFDPIERAVEAYNSAADDAEARFGAHWSRCSWPISDTRKKQLRARLKECDGIDGWITAMARAVESPLLNGTKPRSAGHENWWPGFDFFLQAKSFTKLLEGSYDQKSGATSASGGGFLDAAARVAARRASGGDY